MILFLGRGCWSRWWAMPTIQLLEEPARQNKGKNEGEVEEEGVEEGEPETFPAAGPDQVGGYGERPSYEHDKAEGAGEGFLALAGI